MTKEYQEYLESPKWKEFRKKVFEHYGRRCNKCQTTKNLQIHHLHYNNIFNEKLEDVRVLCKYHHEETHGLKQKKVVVKKRTVAQEQARIDKKLRKREKRRKKKLGKLVQERMYRQHIQAQKPNSKKKNKPKSKAIKTNFPSIDKILENKQRREAWRMRVVE